MMSREGGLRLGVLVYLCTLLGLSCSSQSSRVSIRYPPSDSHVRIDTHYSPVFLDVAYAPWIPSPRLARIDMLVPGGAVAINTMQDSLGMYLVGMVSQLPHSFNVTLNVTLLAAGGLPVTSDSHPAQWQLGNVSASTTFSVHVHDVSPENCSLVKRYPYWHPFYHPGASDYEVAQVIRVPATACGGESIPADLQAESAIQECLERQPWCTPGGANLAHNSYLSTRLGIRRLHRQQRTGQLQQFQILSSGNPARCRHCNDTDTPMFATDVYYARAVGPEIIPITVNNTGDGLYSFTYVPLLPGFYSVEVLLMYRDGRFDKVDALPIVERVKRHVLGSPFSVHVAGPSRLPTPQQYRLLPPCRTAIDASDGSWVDVTGPDSPIAGDAGWAAWSRDVAHDKYVWVPYRCRLEPVLGRRAQRCVAATGGMLNLAGDSNVLGLFAALTTALEPRDDGFEARMDAWRATPHFTRARKSLWMNFDFKPYANESVATIGYGLGYQQYVSDSDYHLFFDELLLRTWLRDTNGGVFITNVALTHLIEANSPTTDVASLLQQVGTAMAPYVHDPFTPWSLSDSVAPPLEDVVPQDILDGNPETVASLLNATAVKPRRMIFSLCVSWPWISQTRIRTAERVSGFNRIANRVMAAAGVDMLDVYAMSHPRLDKSCDGSAHFACLGAEGVVGVYEALIHLNLVCGDVGL